MSAVNSGDPAPPSTEPTVPAPPLVMVFPRGQLTPDDRAALKESRIVAVEADDPSQVVTLLPRAVVSESDLFMSALAGLNAANSTARHEAFAAELQRRLKHREKYANER